MTTSTSTAPRVASTGAGVALAARIGRAVELMSRIPHSLVALIGRFAIAGVFWRSGQTKVEGLSIDVVEGHFEFGWPGVTASAVELFRDEYQLPLLPPELGALMAATAEHVLPILLLIGLGTRFAALGLLMMAMVIQLFVYPGAWAVHGTWAAVLLWLMMRGAGVVSLDHFVRRGG